MHCALNGREPRGRSRGGEPRSASESMIGGSAAMRTLRRRAGALGRQPASVLVTGETGVGKELAAHALHAASARSAGPFVAVNCAALPRDLASAELFGSTAGAFTGARARPGLVRAADGGTLFLDEVGELAPHAQGALLRVLEAGRVRAVGAARDEAVDVRLVCATHRDLPRAVSAGTFRADLYHRIAALVLRVPPLRERLEDVPGLAAALAPAVARRLSPAAWQALAGHRWPGNVRELRNVLARAAAEVEVGEIGPEALCFDSVTPADDAPPAGSLEQRVAALVRAELRRQAGNVRQTARALCVSPTTVYRYLSLASL